MDFEKDHGVKMVETKKVRKKMVKNGMKKKNIEKPTKGTKGKSAVSEKGKVKDVKGNKKIKEKKK